MKDFIGHLASQSRAPRVVVNATLDDALTHLDHLLEGVAAALQVEYYGPYVGVETPEAHQLVVRAHEWVIHQHLWSLKVCSTAPQAEWRAEWPIQGCSRLRKVRIVQALPDFFAGYCAAVDASEQAASPSALRIRDLAARFAA
jgi:hypothetical protein